MELLTRPSRLAQVSETLRERAFWARAAAELDEEFGTESVEAAMRAAGADPDAYLASRKARLACDPYFCGQHTKEDTDDRLHQPPHHKEGPTMTWHVSAANMSAHYRLPDVEAEDESDAIQQARARVSRGTLVGLLLSAWPCVRGRCGCSHAR